MTRALVPLAAAAALALAAPMAMAAPAPASPATAAGTATATPTGTASPSPTATSGDPLGSVIDATGKVADQVAAAQLAYDKANAHLTQVQNQLAAAVTAYGVAEDTLATRTADAAQAANDAYVATQLSQGADRELRQQASLLYQGGPGDSYLSAIFGPDGPNGLSDLQVGMAAVLARQGDARIRAEVFAADAARASKLAEAAKAAQAQVADSAKAARTALQAVVTKAQADTAKIAAQQTALLDQLATLRTSSAALEQQREDALAALAGLPAGSSSAASLAKLYASGGSTDLTKAQLNPRAVAKGLLIADGFPASEWPCLDKMWMAESGWNWSATNRGSGAYGIPQSLPGSKMASAGADWLVNPVTQIRWGLTYIENRYGSPCKAWSTWQSRSPHWY